MKKERSKHHNPKRTNVSRNQLVSPQFTRIYTAWKSILGITVLWSLLLLFFVANLTGKNSQHALFSEEQRDILLRPRSVVPYMNLAKKLWDIGYQKEAEYQIALADTVYGFSGEHGVPPDVLGIATRPSEILHSWKHTPRQIKHEYAFWKSVAESHPDYADAQIYSAALAWQLFDTPYASEFLSYQNRLNTRQETIDLLQNLIRLDTKNQ